MLEEFLGIPAHPLLVHAPVVFVPLLAIVTIAYALVPLVRPHTRWVLGLLALATPVTALLAKLSGDAFFNRLKARDRVSGEYIPKIEAHQQLGTFTLFATVALAIMVLVLVYVVGPRVAATSATATGSSLSLPVKVLSVVAALVSLYFVIRTGDSGAKAVWTGS